ncbi:MAG: hypothetical protein K2N39_07165 [Lachnospiraceae bacterium]|nr:hypothetical protein [Lachnospiraceae bacterium]
MRQRSAASLQERQALLDDMDSTLKDAETIIGHMQMIADESARVAEVAANAEQILDEIDEKFEKYTGLNKLDVSFLFLAVALQMVRQYVYAKFPERQDDQTAANNTKGHVKEKSDRKHRYYNPSLIEICGSKELQIPPCPVPFDAGFHANGALEGGGYMGHRVTAIGHDPILGLVFGTANIATSTLTNKDLQSYHIYTAYNARGSKIDGFKNKANTGLVLSKTKDKLLHEGLEGKEKVGASLLKEIIHLRSDIYTKNSLPLPIVTVIDAGLAAELAQRGLDMANIVTVGKQMTFSVFINTMISMLHGLFYDESVEYSRRVYEVRTRKILSYSNFIASASNLIYVGANISLGNESAWKRLDIGGLAVTLYRIVTDAKFIRQVKREFIEQEFFAQIRGSEYDFDIS